MREKSVPYDNPVCHQPVNLVLHVPNMILETGFSIPTSHSDIFYIISPDKSSWAFIRGIWALKYHVHIIRIYRECEGRIETSVRSIAIWHHGACRVMTNGDPEGRIFLSYPHTKNELFFLLTSAFIYLFIYLKKKKKKKLPEVPEYDKMQFHLMMLLDVLG